MSGDGSHFATGTYSNYFRVVGHDGSGDTLLEASRDPTRKRLQASSKLPGAAGRFGLGRSGSRSRSSSLGEEAALSADYSMKLLHMSWHPEANVVATAAANSLYIMFGRENRLGV